MYNCGVCTQTVPARQPAKRITLFREVLQPTGLWEDYYDYDAGIWKRRPITRLLREISKEILACTICHDGHKAGIPLGNLAVMHRPVSASTSPEAARGGHVPDAGEQRSESRRLTSTAPLAGALSSALAKLGKQSSRADLLIAAAEESKPKSKNRYENLKTKKQRDKAKEKQARGKVPGKPQKKSGDPHFRN